MERRECNQLLLWRHALAQKCTGIRVEGLEPQASGLDTSMWSKWPRPEGCELPMMGGRIRSGVHRAIRAVTPHVTFKVPCRWRCMLHPPLRLSFSIVYTLP